MRGEFVGRALEIDLRENGENGVEFSNGQMVFLDFAFQPTNDIQGQFSLNVLGNVANKRPIEFTYGDRGLPYTIEVQPTSGGQRSCRSA